MVRPWIGIQGVVRRETSPLTTGMGWPLVFLASDTTAFNLSKGRGHVVVPFLARVEASAGVVAPGAIESRCVADEAPGHLRQ